MKPSTRRLFLSSTVGIMSATAGCSDIIGDDTENHEPVDTPNADDTAPTDEEHRNELSESNAIEGHASGINDVTSLTVATKREFAEDDDIYTSEFNFFVDLEEERGYETGEYTDPQHSPSGESYTGENTTYIRSTQQNEVSYITLTEPYDYPHEKVGLERIQTEFPAGAIVEAFYWEETGSTTYDGDEVTVYEASTPANEEALMAVFLRQQPFTDGEFTAELYQDQEEILRYINITFTSESSSETFLLEVTSLNDTTVTEPDWIDDAREQDSNNSD